MKVCVLGSGHSGITTSCVLAQIGHSVCCADTNDYKIKKILDGSVEIFDSEIKKCIKKNIDNSTLRFCAKFEPENDTDIYIVAIGFSQKTDEGYFSDILEVISKILSSITKYTLIVIKSPLSAQDTDKIKNYVKNKTTIAYDIVVMPEFTSKGATLDDLMAPKRILLGTTSKKAIAIIKEMYKPLNAEFYVTDEVSAELTKLAYDSFVATKTSLINEIAGIAEKINADFCAIEDYLSKDEAIASSYFNAGIGFGGSSTAKSINSIINISDRLKSDISIVKAVKIANENQKRLFITKILKHYNYNIEGKSFCVWGLSYKANTGDIKESPSNTIIDTLIRYGATVRAYDPMANNPDIKQFSTKENALLSSNALIILTDWDEFREPDFELIAKNLADKIIFDARNLYLNKDLTKFGLKYCCIGKNYE